MRFLLFLKYGFCRGSLLMISVLIFAFGHVSARAAVTLSDSGQYIVSDSLAENVLLTAFLSIIVLVGLMVIVWLVLKRAEKAIGRVQDTMSEPVQLPTQPRQSPRARDTTAAACGALSAQPE